MSKVQADELAIIPGMVEVAVLTQIHRKLRPGEYGCVVLGPAPTGETGRLLSMPESFQWYTSRLDQWRGRLLRPDPLAANLLPDLNMVDVMDEVAARVRSLRIRLIDPQQSCYLNLFNHPVNAVVVMCRGSQCPTSRSSVWH